MVEAEKPSCEPRMGVTKVNKSQAAANRMVGVMGFGHGIGDGELDLVRPDPQLLAATHQLERRCQVQQNRRGLPDDDLTILQEGRRERWMGQFAVVQTAQHRRHTLPCGLGAARHIDVRCAGRLQREANKFASALDARPVVQFIGHGAHCSLRPSIEPDPRQPTRTSANTSANTSAAAWTRMASSLLTQET